MKEKNWESRIKPIDLWSFDCQQECQDNSVGERIVFTTDCSGTRYTHKNENEPLLIPYTKIKTG